MAHHKLCFWLCKYMTLVGAVGIGQLVECRYSQPSHEREFRDLRFVIIDKQWTIN